MTFAVGEHVHVADRGHPGHHRTPGYLKGKSGTIARVHATFTNPEMRAYGGDGLPKLRLYHVEFERSEVWPGQEPQRDRLYADVFEHWLEQAS